MAKPISAWWAPSSKPRRCRARSSSHAPRAARLSVHRADRLAGHRRHLVGRSRIRERLDVARVPAARRTRASRPGTCAARSSRCACSSTRVSSSAGRRVARSRSSTTAGASCGCNTRACCRAALRQTPEVREVALPPGEELRDEIALAAAAPGRGPLRRGAGQVVRPLRARLVVARICRRTRRSPWRRTACRAARVRSPVSRPARRRAGCPAWAWSCCSCASTRRATRCRASTGRPRHAAAR